jgi:hypothetical protein
MLAAVRRPTGARVAIVLVDVAMLVVGGLLLRAGLAAEPDAAVAAPSLGVGSGAPRSISAPGGSAADVVRAGSGGPTVTGGDPAGAARSGSGSAQGGAGGALPGSGSAAAGSGGSAGGPTGTTTTTPSATGTAAGSGSSVGSAAAVIDARPPDAAPAVTDSGSGSGTATDSGAIVEPNEFEAQIASEVGRLTARSQSKFDGCHARASKALPPEEPLRGEIVLSFAVNPSGSVAAVRALSNTTGSTELAACLVAIVEAWAFSTTAATSPLEFRRTFRF